MKIPHIIIFLNVFLISALSAQSMDDTIQKVEKYILENKLDSASYYMDVNNEKNELYRNIINNASISYLDFNSFLSKLNNRPSIEYEKISNFINNRIQEPTSTRSINLDYVEIKWAQISQLRDEVSLEKATIEHDKLEKYIAKFNEKNIEVIRAKTKIKTHPIVMYLIQKDPKGKELCEEALETARKLKDIELEIIFLYHLSDFLVIERKLDEYIAVSEKGLELEKKLSTPSLYYHSIIEHLIDAYIFKGGNDERVKTLLNEIYSDSSSRIHAYELYAKFVGTLNENSTQKKEILEKFEVKNVLELSEKFKDLGKDLNQLDFASLIEGCSRALVAHGFYNEAIAYKNNQINLVKNIYSKDLSETLANYKTALAVKDKEIELEVEKERTRLFVFVACLVGIFLFISLLTLRKIRLQSKELSKKNKMIQNALKDKDLLVREVHHRVKNNFQIISSLLELQLEGLEDEKAIDQIKQGKERIKSMALIHQKLYRSESGLIDFNEYVGLLVKEISFVYEMKIKVITKIEVENIFLDVDTAIPLGLIINEAVTNSFKYAFGSDKINTLFIRITKEKDHNYKLILEDNGSGISTDLDLTKTTSLGLKLIYRLVKQLHGTITQTNENGAKFAINFKDKLARKMTH
jgi:two-component sensor histidine kinase